MPKNKKYIIFDGTVNVIKIFNIYCCPIIFPCLYSNSNVTEHKSFSKSDLCITWDSDIEDKGMEFLINIIKLKTH